MLICCCGQQNHDQSMRLLERIDRVRYNHMQTSPIASDTSTRLHVLILSLLYRCTLSDCLIAIVLSDVFLWDAEHVAVAWTSRDCTLGTPLRLNLSTQRRLKMSVQQHKLGVFRESETPDRYHFKVSWRIQGLIHLLVTMQRCTQERVSLEFSLKKRVYIYMHSAIMTP
jgi:hypothetical protein